MLKPFKLFPLMLLFTSIQAQTFYDKTNWLPDPQFRSGLTIAVTDFNGDHYPDLLRMRNGKSLEVGLMVPGDTVFVSYSTGVAHPSPAWCLVVGDVNNDGFKDIVTGGNSDQIILWKMGRDGQVIEKTILPESNIYVQAANFVDINNDGWLDLFVCNDDGISRIYGNDGQGNLQPQTGWLNLQTTIPSDNSGNYGSIWTDFDQDGDLDLYISKCKGAAQLPTDPRRINQLFVNYGPQGFKEEGVQRGLALGDQSWVSDFGDVDNDGDLDCIVFNHDPQSRLMINDGGVFKDYTDSMGVKIEGLLIQGFFRDMDNDGHLDIVVLGNAPYYYHNDGNYHFSGRSVCNAQYTMTSGMVADFNGDGYMDIYGIYGKDFVQPGPDYDKLWIQKTGEYCWVTIGLEGTVSNRDGIGATIEIYSSVGKQIREVRAGEAYGVTASPEVYAGIGSDKGVEKVIVRWPSGIVDSFGYLPANKRYVFTEGQCRYLPVPMQYAGIPSICGGDSLTLSLPGWDSLVWSTGSTEPQLQVKASGIYFGKGILNGCPQVSEPLRVVVDPVESPRISLSGDSILCEGGEVFLSLPEARAYTWNNGSTERSIRIDQPGVFWADITGQCADFKTDTVRIQFIPVSDPDSLEDVTLPGPGMTVLHAVGDSLLWYEPENGILVGTGNDFQTPFLTSTTTYYVSNVTTYPGYAVGLGEVNKPTVNVYHNNNFNGRLIFNVYQALTLDSVTVFTDTPGVRRIILVKGADILASREVMLDTGATVVALNFTIEPGLSYELTTDAAYNRDLFGVNSPFLYRTVGLQGAYPYGDPGTIEIIGNNYGLEEYYYFYRWKVRTIDRYCESEHFPVQVHIMTSSSELLEQAGWKVFPNPVNSMFFVQPHPDARPILELRLFDVQGRVQWESRSVSRAETNSISMGELPAGMYWLSVKTAEGSYNVKILKF
ncbi:MAG: VCBS repeat-containing protein [Lewinellaceae bacterium]|nr:VCBS repeat-containing protein [Lewinellaceae bacterium]